MSIFDLGKFKTSDISVIYELVKRNLNGYGWSNGDSETETKQEDYFEKQHEKEQKERQRTLKKAIERITGRLKEFLATGVWKVRIETRLVDEDSKLQNLLINLNKQWLTTKSLAESLYDSKELKKNEELKALKALIDEAVDKIQMELKFRETRRDKRKFTFLIDT